MNVERSLDIYLNDVVCWRNVPEPVWEYTIGGYQVIKKWKHSAYVKNWL